MEFYVVCFGGLPGFRGISVILTYLRILQLIYVFYS